MICNDCPRKCNVDREKTVGFCKEKNKIRVAKIIENFKWEEPCISGEKGALAIFFSGCNLRCNFCQNFDISHIGKGNEYTPSEFLTLIKSYDLTKFSCIDLITPTHFSSLLLQALKDFDCPIPIVWNSSAYENEEMIEKISSIVDVFLPDLKYFSSDLSRDLSFAENYFDVASKATIKMREMKKENKFDGDILKEGVLIRHLVLPDHTDDSKKILDFIKNNISSPFVSLMSQFTPIGDKIKRKIYPLEYKIVLSYAEKIGLTEGYFQDYDSADDNFIPEF
jgi:putative pyruvate formate lyase activating enzyme